MKMMHLALLFSINAVTVTAGATKAKVTPVQKVIQLLEDMSTQGLEELRKEQVEFSTYKSFCDNTAAQKKSAIEKESELIEQLQATIMKTKDEEAALALQITKHDEDVSVWEGDETAATRVRGIENADFQKLHKDYSESISAVQRAIQVLQAQNYDRPQATALLQLNSLKLVPENTKRAITSFVSSHAGGSAAASASAPEANAYEFQSSAVIDMLKKLGDKFQTEIIAIEKQETASKAYYEGLMADLASEISNAKAASSDKTTTRSKLLQTIATKEGELKGAIDDKAADEAYLKDLVSTCEQKGGDFIKRQELRKEELETIKKATAIISGEDVAGSAEKYLPSLAQESGAALAQLRASRDSEVRDKLEYYLRSQSATLHSRVLSMVAQHAAADPLRKVKKMIKDLIYKLMEEANEEATHKGWCDTELATNLQTRKEKTTEVESLNAEIDQLQASIAKLTEEIGSLTKGLAQLEINMNEATKIRVAEKAENIQTIGDAQTSQTAVAQALTVLKEFYAKASEATSFAQSAHGQTPPAIFDSPYTGMQSEGGGVISMLQLIESDFARLEATTKAAEATAAKEYEKLSNDIKVDKAEKTANLEHTQKMKVEQQHALHRKQEDVESSQKELQSALFYYDKLKPSCVDAGVSYEDRVARRQDEIESLQSALRILNQEEIDF